ncbi:MAG: hypothetical protein M1596_05365 [Firmicutes bacterium]|nr:hypothetical protein [Bacillota bacterium]
MGRKSKAKRLRRNQNIGTALDVNNRQLISRFTAYTTKSLYRTDTQFKPIPMSLTIPQASLGEPGTWQNLWVVPSYREEPVIDWSKRKITVTFWVGSSIPELKISNWVYQFPHSQIKIAGPLRAGAIDGTQEYSIQLVEDREAFLDKLIVEVPKPIQTPLEISHQAPIMKQAVSECFHVASDWLSALSVASDAALTIHYLTAQDSGSGIQWTIYQVPHPEKRLHSMWTGPYGPMFRHAMILYREGRSSENPAYQVLTYYKLARLLIGGEKGIGPGLIAAMHKWLEQQDIASSFPSRRWKGNPYDGQKYAILINGVLQDARDKISHAILDNGDTLDLNDWDDWINLREIANVLHTIVRELLGDVEQQFRRGQTGLTPP